MNTYINVRTVRHGAYVIPPHGLRRTWRVEYHYYGSYTGATSYTSRKRAMRAAQLHNTQGGK